MFGAYKCVCKSHRHINGYLQVCIADQFLQLLAIWADISREPLFDRALVVDVRELLRNVSIQRLDVHQKLSSCVDKLVNMKWVRPVVSH